MRSGPCGVGVPAADSPGIRDLTGLPWTSIDNDDTRDLYQLTCNGVAALLEGGDEVPAGIVAVKGLTENLRVQDRIARSRKACSTCTGH